ncbi:MAG TPA: hypothetical protein VNS32_12850 [Flavisolibacter sp.]|nr:hypothetical protein [Flavisolibacter sp.]
MEVPKIQLSATEIDLMSNASIILTKNSILKKIRELLETMQMQQLEYIRNGDHASKNELLLIPPKISKGESYLGLPYLILDYPRHSAPGDLFFIRNMFWWGQYFSTTLHVSGKSKAKIKNKILEQEALLSKNNYFIGVNDDPWVHHFEEINYKSMNLLASNELAENLSARDHIKIAAKWPLNNVHLAAINMYESWKLFLRITGLVP